MYEGLQSLNIFKLAYLVKRFINEAHKNCVKKRIVLFQKNIFRKEEKFEIHGESGI